MSWSVNNLTNDLKRLKTLYNKENDPTKKYELSSYIYCLEEIISNFTFDDKTKVVNQGNFFKTLYSIPRYRIYMPFINEFISILYKHQVQFPEISNVDKREYSKKDMYELTRNFYQQIGGNFYEAFKEFDKEKRNRINYCNFDSNESTTYFIPGVNKFYINLGADSDDRDIIESYIHEAGHVVTAKINNRRYNSSDIFIEIETLFFEILADDFLSKETNDKFFKDLEKEKVDVNYDKANILDIMYNAYDAIINNAKDVDNPNKLFNDICRDENLIKPKLVNVDTVMKYVFSYICAVELASIYKEDKEKGLYLLNNIIRENRNISEYEKIIRNITPNEHLDGYIKTLKKEK